MSLISELTESLVVAAGVHDDVESSDAAKLLVNINLEIVSAWHNCLQLDLTHPVAVDRLDEHVHGGDELCADLLDATLAEDLTVDAAAVLVDEVGPHGSLADGRGHAVAGDGGTFRDGTLEVGELRLEAVENVGVGGLGVASQGGVVEGGTAGAATDVLAVAKSLVGVSKDSAVCVMPLSTYQVSGHRESGTQAEDAEESDEKQQDCREFVGDGHGGDVGAGE